MARRKGKDLISQLPDDILLHILSMVRYKEAVRTAANLRNDDAGPWSLHLPAATACLSMESCWYSVRPPHVHGPGASALKSLTFKDSFMVLHPGYLQDTAFPSLEELHISGCTLSGSIEITSATMPRLKHLRIADVSLQGIMPGRWKYVQRYIYTDR
uniref:F-box domain-containing protein n=1 Tax=Oryza barthii TaxID=65489 RepID=A0A0D3GBY2_9ORYZ